jgi:hypothetical protein
MPYYRLERPHILTQISAVDLGFDVGYRVDAIAVLGSDCSRNSKAQFIAPVLVSSDLHRLDVLGGSFVLTRAEEDEVGVEEDGEA